MIAITLMAIATQNTANSNPPKLQKTKASVPNHDEYVRFYRDSISKKLSEQC